MRATGLRTDERSGVLHALAARDDLTGTDLEIRTRTVIDATGVWAADPAHPFPSPSQDILPSRGAHLVVRRERIQATAGMTIRVPGKIVFLVPWPDHWLVGTTDAVFISNVFSGGPCSIQSDTPILADHNNFFGTVGLCDGTVLIGTTDSRTASRHISIA